MAQLRRIVKKEEIGVTSSIELSHTQCAEDFLFEFHGNHLRPFPEKIEINGVETPWYEALTENEQLAVFREALSEYRQRSRSDFKLATIGVTVEGDIFVAENTESLADPFYRQCSEQNMVNIATMRDGYQEFKEHLAVGNRAVPMEEGKLPRFRSVFLMGGKEKGALTCPCGNCTKLLHHVMDRDAPIYIMRVAEPRDLSKTQEIEDIRIDESTHVRRVPQGAIWKSSLEKLYPEPTIKLKQPQLTKQAYEAMCERIATRLNAELTGPKELFKLYGDTIVPNPPHQLRVTIPEQPFPEVEVNLFQLDKIEGTIYNRMYDLVKESVLRPSEITGAYVRQLIDANITSVRCVVAQTQRGRFYHAVDTISKLDKAALCAEIGVLSGTTEDSPREGIRNVRVMELNPKNIENGVMGTSPPDGVERLGKRRPKNGDSLIFGFSPFNDGNLKENGLAHVREKRSIEQLLTGAFAGRPQGVISLAAPSGMSWSIRT